MNLIEKREVRRERNDDGIITSLPSIWRAKARDGLGAVQDLLFDHDPTDDEILAQLAPAPARLRGTNLADRIEDLAELCSAWQALDFAATTAAGDAAFTAQERNRLAAARDALRARVKAYV